MNSDAAPSRYVALLRGVNVGGVKVLMKPLRELAENLGWTDVVSYIASGNLVFSAKGIPADLARSLRAAIRDELGVDTPVLVLEATDMRAILQGHPWTPQKGNQSHVYFCWDRPEIDNDLYQNLKAPDEELRIVEGHVHFLAPNGIGGSKLAEKLGKVVCGTEVTGRNLNTVRKLAAMASV